MSIDRVAALLRGGPDGGGVEIVVPAGSKVSAERVFKVLVVLAEHANADGIAWPAVDTISAEGQMPVTAARRGLRAAEVAGLVAVDGHRSGGRQPTRYRVLPGVDGRRSRDPQPGHVDDRVNADSQPGHVDDRVSGSTRSPATLNPVIAMTAEPPEPPIGGGGGVRATGAPPDGGPPSPADRKRAAAWLRGPFANVYAGKQTPSLTDALAVAIVARLDAGWNEMVLAHRVGTDWPARVRSRAGLLLHRLNAEPVAPDELAVGDVERLDPGGAAWDLYERLCERCRTRYLAAVEHLEDDDGYPVSADAAAQTLAAARRIHGDCRREGHQTPAEPPAAPTIQPNGSDAAHGHTDGNGANGNGARPVVVMDLL